MKPYVIATVALLVIGGTASVGGCGGDGEPVDEAASPTPIKDFAMLLGSDDEFQEAAQQIQDFMPDFDCTGGWNTAQKSGTLECHAGSSGFTCTLKGALEAPGSTRTAQVICLEGAEAPEGSPSCTARPAAPAYSVRCAGPNTDASCSLRLPSGQGEDQPFQLTCERA
jgi:hypothetical protein